MTDDQAKARDLLESLYSARRWDEAKGVTRASTEALIFLLERVAGEPSPAPHRHAWRVIGQGTMQCQECGAIERAPA